MFFYNSKEDVWYQRVGGYFVAYPKGTIPWAMRVQTD